MRTLAIQWRTVWVPTGVLFFFTFVAQIPNAQDTEYRGTVKKLTALLATGESLSPTHLVLYNEEFNPDDFGAIKKNCTIETIVWGEFPDGVDVTNDSIRSLASLTTLRELSIYVSTEHAVEWGELRKLTNLKHLNLFGNISFSEDSLRDWSQLTHLESLELSGDFESAACFKFLGDLKGIRSFKLNMKTANLDVVEIVQPLKKLKRLEFYNVEGVSSKQLAEIVRICGGNLEELVIILNDVTS